MSVAPPADSRRSSAPAARDSFCADGWPGAISRHRRNQPEPADSSANDMTLPSLRRPLATFPTLGARFRRLKRDVRPGTSPCMRNGRQRAAKFRCRPFQGPEKDGCCRRVFQSTLMLLAATMLAPVRDLALDLLRISSGVVGVAMLPLSASFCCTSLSVSARCISLFSRSMIGRGVRGGAASAEPRHVGHARQRRGHRRHIRHQRIALR